MIFAKDGENWIIGTKKKNNQREEINDLLRKDEFTNEKILTEDDKEIDVWSRLKLVKLNNDQIIEKEIAFLLDEEDEMYWWSNQLLLLNKRKDNK